MEVRLKRCGDNNLHWFGEGNTCLCGQIPYSIFFAAHCTCGASRYINPVHKPDCVYVGWAKKRNYWIQEHPNLKPRLDKVNHSRLKPMSLSLPNSTMKRARR